MSYALFPFGPAGILSMSNQLPQQLFLAAEGSQLDQPRERLERLGVTALGDAELIALVIRTGIKGRNCLVLANQVLNHFGGLSAMLRCSPVELAQACGIGPAKAASLQAAFEIGRRHASRRLSPGSPLSDASEVYAQFFMRLRDLPQEQFLVVILDARQRWVRSVEVSRGTLTSSLVHPREVFRQAIRDAAASILLVHNHPSGDPTPSEADRQITERLVVAGDLLGVPVLDHVIIAEQGFFSFAEEGVLEISRFENSS